MTEAALISALEVLNDSLSENLSEFVSQYFSLPPSAVIERGRLTELLIDRLHCPDGAWSHWTNESNTNILLKISIGFGTSGTSNYC
jgi:hypothetical protein